MSEQWHRFPFLDLSLDDDPTLHYPKKPYRGPFRTPIHVLFETNVYGQKVFELRQAKMAPIGHQFETEREAVSFAEKRGWRVQRQRDGVFLLEGKGEWNV